MVTYSADTGGIMTLGGDIVGMAARVDGAARDVGGTPCLAGPPETAAALARFARAYGRSTDRLRDDVVALGRLTQAAAAEYDAVETAAAQVDRVAGTPSGGPGGGSDGGSDGGSGG
jgi:hypothetical protein